MAIDRDDVQKISHLVETYGADPARWPIVNREGLLALARSDAAVARLLSEAAALDRLLATAPQSVSEAEAARACDRLMSRLAAQTADAHLAPAIGETQVSGGAHSNVVRLPLRDAPAGTKSTSSSLGWRDFGILAASLAIGVFAGAQGIAERAGLTDPLVAMWAIGGQWDEDPSLVAFDGDGESGAEEDML